MQLGLRCKIRKPTCPAPNPSKRWLQLLKWYNYMRTRNPAWRAKMVGVKNASLRLKKQKADGRTGRSPAPARPIKLRLPDRHLRRQRYWFLRSLLKGGYVCWERLRGLIFKVVMEVGWYGYVIGAGVKLSGNISTKSCGGNTRTGKDKSEIIGQTKAMANPIHICRSGAFMWVFGSRSRYRIELQGS